MASRGQSQGPDAGTDSRSAGSPPPLPRLARLAPHRTPEVTWKVTWRAGAGSLVGGLARLAWLARFYSSGRFDTPQ